MHIKFCWINGCFHKSEIVDFVKGVNKKIAPLFQLKGDVIVIMSSQKLIIARRIRYGKE